MFRNAVFCMLLLALAWVSACSGLDVTAQLPTASPSPTGTPGSTATPVPTATPSPTATPGSTTTPIPTWTPLPTWQPRPDYISWVNPEESSHVAQAHYEYEEDEWAGRPSPELGFASTVCVGPDINYLYEKGDFFDDFDVLIERMELQVDGIARRFISASSGGILVQVHEDDEAIAEFDVHYSFCWHAPVESGIHDVSFKFRQTSGTVREYKWQFSTTADSPPQVPTATPAGTPAPMPINLPLPTSEPWPDFLTELWPEPAVVISVEDLEHQVCIGLDRGLLFGDEPCDEQYFEEHLQVTLNGTPIEHIRAEQAQDAVTGTTRLEKMPVMSDEITFTIGESPSCLPPLKRCWLEIEILPGMYQGVIQFTRPSGEVLEYSWFFALTDD